MGRPVGPSSTVSLPSVPPSSASQPINAPASSPFLQTAPVAASRAKEFPVPGSTATSAFTHHSKTSSCPTHGMGPHLHRAISSSKGPSQFDERVTSRTASKISRSISSPAVGTEARKRQYEAKLADWKHGRASLGDEFGIR